MTCCCKNVSSFLCDLLLQKLFTDHKVIQKLGLFLTLKVEGQFPHMHNVGLSKVTTIEGLHITDLCEAKRAVSLMFRKKWNVLELKANLSLV